MRLQRRKLRARSRGGARLAGDRFPSRRVRRTALLIAALTAVNIVIVLLAGYGSLHSMESPGFCGQACHTPMHPQFTAWQQAAHARVACVECHIGEGGSGVRAREAVRRAAAGRGRHELAIRRPIPPGANMPPGAPGADLRAAATSPGARPAITSA